MRLVIIGYSGAGKTTLAKALSEALGCGVLHVDEEMCGFFSGRRKASEAMRAAESRMAALQGADWIIDGYRPECIKREWLSEASRIVFLDLGKWTCFWRVFRRQNNSYYQWAIHQTKKNLRSNRKPQEQPAGTDTKKPISYYVHYMFNDIRHLTNIIRKGHRPEIRAYYMGIGGEWPEKFTVLRTKKEVRQFQAALQKNAEEEKKKDR